MTEREELVEQIKIYKKWLRQDEAKLAQLEAKEDGRPKVGDEYWLVDSDGTVTRAAWFGSNDDLCRWDLGNVYFSWQDGKDAIRRQQIRTRLQRLADASGDGGFGCGCGFGPSDDGVTICSFLHNYGIPRFATRESAEAAVEDIGEDDLRFLLEGE